MSDRHQKCVYKSILDGVEKFGQDWINVQKDQRIDKGKCDEQGEKPFIHSSASGFGDLKINKQNRSSE